MTDNIVKYPLILSFDVGVIHLSYCLLTKKDYIKPDGSTSTNWFIIDWNNIDLTNRQDEKCHCGAKASLIQTYNGEQKYYCRTHGKKVNCEIDSFDNIYEKCNKEKICGCTYKSQSKNQEKICGKSGTLLNIKTNQNYCTTHAKQLYKSDCNNIKLKPFKTKSSTTLNFDDVKYSLVMELEKRKLLLNADYVVIENQPSMKNPRMKSIASTLYDYYLIRGIIDKQTTKSNIEHVKFMSPSNKLKIASEGDTKELVKAKKTDETQAYKLTKSLGIKYCLDLTSHLPRWTEHFNSFKKKDDLADSFLQGAYFYTHCIDFKNTTLKRLSEITLCENLPEVKEITNDNLKDCSLLSSIVTVNKKEKGKKKKIKDLVV